MQCPPAVRPSRPSRHPTEFLTASLLPPPSSQRLPSSISHLLKPGAHMRRKALPLRSWCVGDHSGTMPRESCDWRGGLGTEHQHCSTSSPIAPQGPGHTRWLCPETDCG
ncbi:hypothetical protein CLIM01_14147 [Colletotrichum limetticola]|uniref:Uncharacterized protein n=1 Tax=Colletotrichum limetticola TaxID=1209924 RepID=A0ABQ9P8U2_9PEZI|nr:hypothetical protein CLIM01_14147 [Colletotrichum limetticola]